MHNDLLKQQAAERAVQFIQSGMIVGLGTGSTAIIAVRLLANHIHKGNLKDILAVPTSLAIETEARKLGIPLTTLDEHPIIDVTIDGADEVDSNFNLIKGGGGALLREKIVAQAICGEIIVIDESKLSKQLGTHWAVPVEVVPLVLWAGLRYTRIHSPHPTVFAMIALLLIQIVTWFWAGN